jgi:hypothetical protein
VIRPGLRVAAGEDRGKIASAQEATELEQQQHVAALGIIGAADEDDVGLSGGDPGPGGADRVDAGLLLAHQRARGAGDAVDDRDIAGE